MKKIVRIVAVVLASAMLESGCCTAVAVAEDQTWVTPVTVPVDVVLLPVEFLCFETIARVSTGGHSGVFGVLDAMGSWH